MENKDYILFDKYLLGDLSKEDINAFELRLETDLTFKKNFNTYKELFAFLEHKFKNEEASAVFQNNLKNISKTYFKKQELTKKVMRFKPWQYAIAASVVLWVSIALFNDLSDPAYQDYANYDSISLTVRGDGDAMLKTAENAFNAKDFSNAEKAFRSLLITDKDNIEWQFYSALSNIELNNFEMAEHTLMAIIKGQSAFKNKAIWYLALSKLKQKKFDDCLKLLKTIPEEADEYKKAQKLIRKLD
jgi:tetratricopeptide (TPR) repeat protein